MARGSTACRYAGAKRCVCRPVKLLDVALYAAVIVLSLATLYMVLNVNERTLEQTPVYQDF